MARIELKNLAHSYEKNPQLPEDYALRELDLEWQQGMAYALLGPSGCGKTTLLNIISGLLQPSQGKVLFDDEDVTALPPQSRNIAQVFQFPVVYDTMTVFQNLAFPLRNRGIAEGEVKNRVNEVADMLELSDVLNKRASNLTADEKQKISMGRGLVRNDVSAILFDEPLTVIDPHLKWALRRKLKEVHERFNHTMIYVTHDQLEAMTFADQVVVMLEGQVLQVGPPDDLFENPAHTFVGYFIGSPGMNVLPCSIEGEAARVAGNLIALPAGLADKAGRLPGALELGIRPEYLKLNGDAGVGRLAVAVTEVEDLGNYTIAKVDLDGHMLYVKWSEDKQVTVGNAYLEFPPSRIKIYAESKLVV